MPNRPGHAALPAAKTDAEVVLAFLLMNNWKDYTLIFERPPKIISPRSSDAQASVSTTSLPASVQMTVKKSSRPYPGPRKKRSPLPNRRIRKPLQQVERILIKMPNWLGDAVMSLPAVQYMRNLFPRAYIACLIKENIANIGRNSDALNTVITYEHPSGISAFKRKVKTIRQLRSQFFDLAVLMTNSFESALWMYLAGVPLTAGYNTQGRGFLLTHAVRRTSPVGHQIRYYLDLCSALGHAHASATPVLRISDADTEWAEDFLSSIGVLTSEILIGLCPGAAYGPAKRWLPGRFVAVCRAIADNYPAKFAVFGGKGDINACTAVADGIGQRAINFCGKTTLRELTALIHQSALVISNDSGAMHLAAAIGTHVIAIFGSTDPARTAPPANCTVIKKQLPCSPCFKRKCPTDFRCMTSISAEDVYQEAAQILSAKNPARLPRNLILGG